MESKDYNLLKSLFLLLEYSSSVRLSGDLNALVCLTLHTARCTNVATFGHLALRFGTRFGELKQIKNASEKIMKRYAEERK